MKWPMLCSGARLKLVLNPDIGKKSGSTEISQSFLCISAILFEYPQYNLHCFYYHSL